MSSFFESVDELSICRICFDPESLGDLLVSPCHCSGSQKYVHYRCLSMWQCTVLFQEKSSGPDETRHLICNTCGSNFHGISVPTRKKLLASACGEELVASLQRGSFLVASRANSERALSNNFPALVEALFKLKRAHWKYGVYFVFSFGVEGVDDLEGESKVFALNLTRLMDGSSDHPIPDEVLSQQQALSDSYKQEIAESDGDCCPCFPRVTVTHHNGGPVKWSSYRSGMCVVYKELFFLQEQGLCCLSVDRAVFRYG